LALPAIVNGFFGAWLPWIVAALLGTTTLPEGFEEVVLAPLFGAFPACSPVDALVGLTAFFTATLALGAGTGFAFGLAGFRGFLALVTGLVLAAITFFLATDFTAGLALATGFTFAGAFLTGFLAAAAFEGVAFFDFLLF
jgi:hypothetical protein